MTLLNLEPRHEVAVLEMSMYTEGEIARLAEIARPEVGVVLSVHPTHLERAGSIEAIARAKAELPAALPADGLAVLNADDPRVAAMREVTRAAVRTFGIGAAGDVRATEVESHGVAGTSFTLRAPWGERRLHSATPGRHLVPHALAAAIVAEHLGVPLDEVEAALAQGSHAPHRMALVEATTGPRSSMTPITRRRSRSRRRSTSWPRARCRPAATATPCWGTCSSWGRTRSGSTGRSDRRLPASPRGSSRWANAGAGSARPPSRPGWCG